MKCKGYYDFSIFDAYKGIDVKSTKPDCKTGEMISFIQINPNKYSGEYISSLSTFQEVMDSMLAWLGITDYELTRVDFRIDSMEDNFDDYLKLNKLIALLLAKKMNLKNRYQSYDPLLLDNLTIRVQNEYLEFENYNKKLESSGNDPVCNRIELRSKSLLKNPKEFSELLNIWIERLRSLPAFYEFVQADCNDALFKKWNQQSTSINMTSFVKKYEENIYTSRQLRQLCEWIGSKNPVNFAKAVKQRYALQFYKETDIISYIEALSHALLEFGTNCTLIPENIISELPYQAAI